MDPKTKIEDKPEFYPGFQRTPDEGIAMDVPLDDLSVWGGIMHDELDTEALGILQKDIEAQGLIQSLVVDSKLRVLVGRHRLVALQRLREQNTARFDAILPGGKIPVTVQPFDADEDPVLTLSTIAAESNVRQGNRYKEWTRVYKMLEAQGLGVDAKPGRPPKGAATSMQQLMARALNLDGGQNRRYLRRYRSEKRAVVGATPVVEKDEPILPGTEKAVAAKDASDGGVAKVTMVVSGMGVNVSRAIRAVQKLTPEERRDFDSWYMNSVRVDPAEGQELDIMEAVFEDIDRRESLTGVYVGERMDAGLAKVAPAPPRVATAAPKGRELAVQMAGRR